MKICPEGKFRVYVKLPKPFSENCRAENCLCKKIKTRKLPKSADAKVLRQFSCFEICLGIPTGLCKILHKVPFKNCFCLASFQALTLCFKTNFKLKLNITLNILKQHFKP